MIGLNLPSFTDTNTGITLINAFARVETFSGDTNVTIFNVSFYATQDVSLQALSNRPYFMSTSDILGSSSPAINVVYQYLMSLPDFINSTFIQ